MNLTITQENLISFIFNELPSAQHAEIQSAIDADTSLQQDHEALQLSLQELKPIEIHSDQVSKNLILKYSKNVSSMEASI